MNYYDLVYIFKENPSFSLTKISYWNANFVFVTISEWKTAIAKQFSIFLFYTLALLPILQGIIHQSWRNSFASSETLLFGQIITAVIKYVVLYKLVLLWHKYFIALHSLCVYMEDAGWDHLDISHRGICIWIEKQTSHLPRVILVLERSVPSRWKGQCC